MIHEDTISGKEVIDKRHAMKMIEKKLFERVQQKFEDSIELHDNNLQEMAIEICREQGILKNFKGTWKIIFFINYYWVTRGFN